jgi:hypothetical protein
MHRDIQRQRLGRRAAHLVQQHQMRRGRDRQELGDSLHDGQDDQVKRVMVLPASESGAP